MLTQEEREKIFNAAQKIFDEKGVHDATLEDISDASGIALPTIVENFNNKSKILNEILSGGIEVITQYLHKLINERGKSDVKITRLVRKLLQSYEEYYPMFKLIGINMESLNQEDLELKGVLEHEKIERYRQNTTIIGRLIAKGQSEGIFADINPQAAAYLLRGMITAIIKYWQATGKTQPLENFADLVTKIFIKGISK